ncbi:polysaccharide biosynthesis protein [Telmatobacter sp. DSM 110680]|uniref:Polysaccharide biosynthesis protein n=1 Tax=Telmatobacter sp. DSM 110680 TaxID=3036704 RepID=A0AAU7DQC1_9BACT
MTFPLESIHWHDFLARPQLPAPAPESITTLVNHPILITGAGGSIGSALALRLAAEEAHLILLESSENNLYKLQRNFADRLHPLQATFYLGSVTDQFLLNEIISLHRPRLVFHAAAYKHVPLLEDQPFAAIANNIFATETLSLAAAANRARIVLLSTDKAVNPTSIMGATKRAAEQIILSSNGTVLRLGNVLASDGSVTEVFARQLATGIPLTVTDPAARRYFLTIEEAVNLLISAAAELPTLLAPDLPAPHFIADLARFMAHTLAPDHEPSIEFTHLRAGDKETEQLWSANETPHPTNASGLIRLDSPSIPRSQLQSALATLRNTVKTRDLSASLNALRILVPDYSPSSTVLRLRSITATQVTHE